MKRAGHLPCSPTAQCTAPLSTSPNFASAGRISVSLGTVGLSSIQPPEDEEIDVHADELRRRGRRLSAHGKNTFDETRVRQAQEDGVRTHCRLLRKITPARRHEMR